MTLAVPDGAVTIDPDLGTLRGLRFWDGRKWLDPLHSAAGPGGRPHPGPPDPEEQLSGPLPCADPRAWPDDAAWEVREVVQSRGGARARLSGGRTAQGVSAEKELSLRLGEPILYQSCLLPGGQGGLRQAHDPVVRMARGGRLSYSPKSQALTSGPAPGPGRCGPVDLPRRPGQAGPEEQITLVEAACNPLGWTAVLRHAEQDIVFVLSDPEVQPVTLLRCSAGGRMLCIGDGCAPEAGGEAAPGQILRHAIGAVPCPKGWTHVTAITIDQNTLRLEGEGEGAVWLPFDGQFFARAG